MGGALACFSEATTPISITAVQQIHNIGGLSSRRVSAHIHTNANAFQQAVNLTQQGQLERSKAICRAILRDDADNADVLMLRGVIELESGRPLEAVESFRHSIRVQPRKPVAHALLGDALLAVKLPSVALESYARALELQPDLAPAYVGRGTAEFELKRPLEALASFDRALQLQANQPGVLLARGNCLHALKRFELAVENFDQAIAVNPSYADAYHNRGAALTALERAEHALSSFDTALAIDPAFGEAWISRGTALLALHRPAEALDSFEHAQELRGDSAAALCGRGNSLAALQRTPEALASYDLALSLDPDNLDAHFHRGTALLQFDWRPEEAAHNFAALLRLSPEFELAPGFLLHAQQCCADWTVRVPQASPARILESVLGGACADSPFSFLAVSDSAAAQWRCAHSYTAERFSTRAPSATIGALEWLRHDRPRIAYVSADFREHAVSYLLAGLFERHDRQRFETIAISLRPESPDAFGQRVKNAFDRFIDVSGKTDEQVVALMREMQIDIAVDLVGLTEGLRPRIFAWRAAPIQVSYLGFPGTTGLPCMDYIVADEFVIPREQSAHYSEKIVYMPACFQASDDRRPVGGGVLSRADVGLPQTGFVFCCFNNTYKINSAMYDIWMRLLCGTPHSVLWLLGVNETTRENLRREAAARGVDPLRLVFAGRMPYAEHLHRLSFADLFLDTLPFNAGATANDLLWAGVPVITCAGEAFAARMAGSILRAAGLPELITHDRAHYEALAQRLALQPDSLRELKERLQGNRLTQPLFDTDRFCRHLESAFEEMLRRHELGEAPQSFSI